ncbi:putative O-antigen polymerase [Candidatus Magnetomoraceae bacterium gMMP-1]
MGIFEANYSMADKTIVHVAVFGILFIVFIAILINLQFVLAFLCLINITCLLTLIAYRFPYLTIVLVFFLGQVGLEAQLMMPEELHQLIIGPLKIRYDDPIFLGIVLAIILKAARKNKLLFHFLFRDYFFWVLLVIWLGFEIVRSFGAYSIINILGESRTYYQYILLIPYIIAFFQTEDKQWCLFKLLIILSSLFIPIGLIRGWVLHGLGIGITQRWFSASANLALLTGIIALYLSVRHRVLRVNKMIVIFLFIAFLSMTIFSHHRSVWLATGVAFLVLVFTRQLSFNDYVFTLLMGGIVSVMVLYIFQINGKEISSFFDQRMTAFTDYEHDDTANWRYILWLESLSQIARNPFIGKGLGRHFQFISFAEVITTSPHNLYITIAYHMGIIGILLYAAFILQIFWRMRNALRRLLSSQQRTMILTSIVILISSSAYYIAYPFEYFTWLYMGLGISVCNLMGRDSRKKQKCYLKLEI